MMYNKIALINPPYQNRIRAVAQTLPHEPLGLEYIASVLEHEGYDVRIIDINAEKISDITFLKKIKRINPDIVGFTAVTPTIEYCHRLAKKIKKQNSRVITMVGGAHVTATPKNTLKEYPSFDFVIRGEGEYTILDLIKTLNNSTALENVLGITYRKEKSIINNPLRPAIQNLDELPFPARHLTRINLYSSTGSEEAVRIMASRGCPYKCIYCASNLIFGHKKRARSPKNVVDEMVKVNKQFSIKSFIFLDDTFTLNKKWVSNFCNEIINRNMDDVNWVCLARCNTIDKEMLIEMKKAGCNKINLGIESGSQEILDYMGRNMNIDTIKKGFKIAKEVGMTTVGFAIIGMPDETFKSIDQTKNLIMETDPTYLQLSFATPYPGTKFFELAKKEQILNMTNWDDYGYLRSPDIIKHKYVSNADLKKAMFKINRDFYFRPSYILRNLKNILSKGEERKALIKASYKSLIGLFNLGIERLKLKSDESDDINNIGR